jgi:two-component system sensor histidine kinase KdpD
MSAFLNSSNPQMEASHNRRWLSLLRLIGVLAAVAALTQIDFRLLHLNSATAAFTFLILTLALATRVGMRESITASIASMLAYNFFFLPPIGTLTIADPQNWVALFAFLGTAITASHLSSQARQRADEASARQQELQRMYDFSRGLMLGDDDRSLASRIARQVANSFEIETVWLYDCHTDSISRSETVRTSLDESILRAIASSGTTWRDESQNVLIVPVRLGGTSLGSLAIAGREKPSEIALQALTQLVAIAMERARAQEAATLIEATRQNEQLKSTLLDALAHEFKTPLTSIKAAATTLLSRRVLDETERELVTVVDEEADRMNNLVSDAIELARIGTGPVTLHQEFCSPDQLVSSALAEMQTFSEGRDINVSITPNLPVVNADKKLSELVLRQLLSNAFKYSLPGSPIQVDANMNENFVKFQVTNAGPEIPESQRTLIFSKFYRAPEVKARIAGTGMGLNIGREIAEAQGGRLWVESETGSGTRFSFTLPVAVADRPLSESPKQLLS